MLHRYNAPKSHPVRSFTVWQAQSRISWVLLAPPAVLEDDLLELFLLARTVEHCKMDLAQNYLPATTSSSGRVKGWGRAGPHAILEISDLEL